jgi:hypothetical protein
MQFVCPRDVADLPARLAPALTEAIDRPPLACKTLAAKVADEVVVRPKGWPPARLFASMC